MARDNFKLKEETERAEKNASDLRTEFKSLQSVHSELEIQMKMHKQQQQQQQHANSTLGIKQKRQVPRAVEESDDDDDSSSSGAESESDEDEPTPAKPTKRPTSSSTNSSVTTDKSSPGLGSKFLQRFGGASTTTTAANSLSVNTEDANDDLLNSSINSFDVDTPKG